MQVNQAVGHVAEELFPAVETVACGVTFRRVGARQNFAHAVSVGEGNDVGRRRIPQELAVNAGDSCVVDNADFDVFELAEHVFGAARLPQQSFDERV